MSDKKVIILSEDEVNEKTDGLEFMLLKAEKTIEEMKKLNEDSADKQNLTHKEKVFITKEIYEHIKKSLAADQENFLESTAKTMTNTIIVKSTPLMKVAIDEALKTVTEQDSETAKKLDKFSGNFNNLINIVERSMKLEAPTPAPADNTELLKRMDQMESKFEMYRPDKKQIDKIEDMAKTIKQSSNDLVDRSGSTLRCFGAIAIGIVGTLLFLALFSQSSI